jgi:hypothetical protein
MKQRFTEPKFYSPLHVPQPQFIGLRDRQGKLIVSRDDPEYMIAYLEAMEEICERIRNDPPNCSDYRRD